MQLGGGLGPHGRLQCERPPRALELYRQVVAGTSKGLSFPQPRWKGLPEPGVSGRSGYDSGETRRGENQTSQRRLALGIVGSSSHLHRSKTGLVTCAVNITELEKWG